MDELNGDLELELDEEEQSWRAVWANEPTGAARKAAPIAAAAQVRLTFLATAAAFQERRRLAWAVLPALDKAIADSKDPSNVVAFGTLMAPFLPDELKGAELNAGAIEEISFPLIQQLHVTRRDSERLRYLLLAQRKLTLARKKNTQAEPRRWPGAPRRRR